MNKDNYNHMAPARSMLDVVRAANRRCDNSANCMIMCEYYDFCNALKVAYYEVLEACKHDKQLKSFIADAIQNELKN